MSRSQALWEEWMGQIWDIESTCDTLQDHVVELGVSVEVLVMPHIFLPDSGHSCGFRWIPEE